MLPCIEPESKSAKPAERERKKEDTEKEESSEVSVTEESSEEEEETRVWILHTSSPFTC